MPDDVLVLVQNEVTVEGRYDFWRDIIGVQYHYPNTYKGKICPGVPFLYYRGVRRRSGVRAKSEYFGRGVISAVWQDPETQGSRPNWYASIEEYEPFAIPVLAHRSDGTSYEVPRGKSGNRYFSVAARRISREVYEEIIAAAGVAPPAIESTAALSKFASLDETLLEPIKPGDALLVRSSGAGGARGNGSAARSVRSKAVGDRAEELVFRRLQLLGRQPRWVSKEGLTPGWDIEYPQASGRVAVEVKGSTGDRFTSVELTGNEWDAAQRERANYHLYLVARCATARPNLEVIIDPASLVERGDLSALPTSWAIVRAD